MNQESEVRQRGRAYADVAVVKVNPAKGRIKGRHEFLITMLYMLAGGRCRGALSLESGGQVAEINWATVDLLVEPLGAQILVEKVTPARVGETDFDI